MKKIYFLLLVFCIGSGVHAQIITIPDANFKNKLLAASPSNQVAKDLSGNWFRIDANANGEIEVAEAEQVSLLNINCYGCTQNQKINSLTGILNFVNLNQLDCSLNNLASLNVNNLSSLEKLYCGSNNLTSLGLNGLVSLSELNCAYNSLSTIDISDLQNLNIIDVSMNQIQNIDFAGLTNLQHVHCQNNQIEYIDLNNNSGLVDLYCSNNQLEMLFIKGTNINEFTSSNIDIEGNPTLKYICVDNSNIQYISNFVNPVYFPLCHVNSYCSFVPGGTYYTIEGNNKFDLNANGCDVSDLAIPNLKYSISDGSLTGSMISNASGDYSIPVQSGTHTVAPLFENPTYFNVIPASLNVSFPAQASPFNQNFCVMANGVHPDFEVTLLPMGPARPGFDAAYKLVYKNKGNLAQSGTVTLSFLDSVLDFVSATPVATSQALNTLTWDFTNLQPFETREIAVTMNVNSPLETPAVNSGDQLNFSILVTTPVGDDTAYDNTSGLKQIVVNSFDPNDKTCLEGATIAPSEVGKYVHYMIRFENTGTFPAENIVVKDMIDTNKFDINTLVPIKGSHSFVTNITGNKVEFIFENINLPFADANNDGYVAFKIKTKPTLVVGNTFSNSASIYFDYNFPIVTNTAITTIAALSTQDFGFESYFSLYPNPVNDVLNIKTKQTIEVSSVNIYNQLGQLVLVVPNAQNVSKVDVSSLSSGNYFIKINSDKGTSNTKFIKK